MDRHNEREAAAAALATVREHEDKTRRAARLPWWAYAGMFLLTVAATCANDVLGRGGAKIIGAILMVMLVVGLVMSYSGKPAPLSRLRGVQLRRQSEPRLYGALVFFWLAAIGLITHYGGGAAQQVADAIGVGNYPNTVAGVLYGGAMTALFGLSHYLMTMTSRR